MTKRSIPRALRRRLLVDARGRCAYCRTLTSITGARLVIDHIVLFGLEMGWYRADDSGQIMAAVDGYFLSHQHSVIQSTNLDEAKKSTINFRHRGPNLIQVCRQHNLSAGQSALLSQFNADYATHPVALNTIDQRCHFG